MCIRDSLWNSQYKEYLTDDDRCPGPMLNNGVMLTHEFDIRKAHYKRRRQKAFSRVLQGHLPWSEMLHGAVVNLKENDERAKKMLCTE